MINLLMDPNVHLLSILPLQAAQTIWVVLPLSILQLLATNNTVAPTHKLVVLPLSILQLLATNNTVAATHNFVVLPLSTLQLLMANTQITVNLSKDVVTLQLIANKETTTVDMVDLLQAAMVKVTDMADKVVLTEALVLTEVMVGKADMVLVTTEDMVVTVADMVVTVVVMVEDMVAMAAMVLVTTDVMEAMVAMEVTVGTLTQVQFTSTMMKIVVAMVVIVIGIVMTMTIVKKTKDVKISVGDMFDASIRKTNYLNNFLSII
jgi:hypothetical protein